MKKTVRRILLVVDVATISLTMWRNNATGIPTMHINNSGVSKREITLKN